MILSPVGDDETWVELAHGPASQRKAIGAPPCRKLSRVPPPAHSETFSRRKPGGARQRPAYSLQCLAAKAHGDRGPIGQVMAAAVGGPFPGRLAHSPHLWRSAPGCRPIVAVIVRGTLAALADWVGASVLFLVPTPYSSAQHEETFAIPSQRSVSPLGGGSECLASSRPHAARCLRWQAAAWLVRQWQSVRSLNHVEALRPEKTVVWEGRAIRSHQSCGALRSRRPGA